MANAPEDPSTKRVEHTASMAPAADGSGTAGQLPDSGADEQPGDEIGPYKLLSRIGEGGFGTVWLAERRVPFVQRVALKVIKPGMDSRSVVARFEQERQALAVMNHPGIAKVLDGGLTPGVRPYFAMEFVKGEPITSFCDARRLGIRERLLLFVQACEAMQHAHLKGIVHRDLKPSNILAFDVEGEGPRLKVIDFGVAKAMSQPLTDKTIFTETGQMIGTPAYMSPEQADPSASDIDTRSDIYSLGVLLYELMTGATPFDGKTLRAKAYDEIRRIIREEDPPTPSARLSTISTKDADLASRIGRSRGIALRELTKRLKGELEWIPLKAMRKEPQYRYPTATHLADDIHRYLRGAPLHAAPESRGYRLRKWLRRNRSAARGAAIGFVMLCIGVSIPPIGARIREMRETARMTAFEIVAFDPDPAVVTDADARSRIAATGRPWKIRHSASGIVLLLVPPGEFVMGSPEAGGGADPDGWMQHRREIRRPFYLSECEVSQAEWRALTGQRVSYFIADNLPVESVSWDTIQNDFLEPSRGSLRLPTEAEWEYACRAGATTAFCFGETLDSEQAHVIGSEPIRCRSFPANAWGFHDMHGNVWEWVEDVYADYPVDGGTEEAVRQGTHNLRVMRGGGFYGSAQSARSWSRHHDTPGGKGVNVGFRVAHALP